MVGRKSTSQPSGLHLLFQKSVCGNKVEVEVEGLVVPVEII